MAIVSTPELPRDPIVARAAADRVVAEPAQENLAAAASDLMVAAGAEYLVALVLVDVGIAAVGQRGSCYPAHPLKSRGVRYKWKSVAASGSCRRAGARSRPGG